MSSNLPQHRNFQPERKRWTHPMEPYPTPSSRTRGGSQHTISALNSVTLSESNKLEGRQLVTQSFPLITDRDKTSPSCEPTNVARETL